VEESEKRMMDPGAAEVMAFFHGVSLCISLGFQNVFFGKRCKNRGGRKKRGRKWFPECSLGCKKKKKKRWGRKCAVEREMGKKMKR
jgi:hypothetical protein